MKPRRRISTAVAVLFGLPFCAAGLLFGHRSVESFARSDWSDAGLSGIFALVFAFAGVGTLLLVGVGSKRLAEIEMVRERNHDEPWNWRPEWREGRIRGLAKPTVGFVWIFALLWNLVSLPGTLAAFRELRDGSDARLYLSLLFPSVGVGLLILALRATWRHLRFGVAVFHLDRVPGVIGRGISGTIIAGFEGDDCERFELKLTCLRRRTGGADSVREIVLWQEERILGRNEVSLGAGQLRIPVGFAIPTDAEPTSESGDSDRVLWHLAVAAGSPAVALATRFEVPVFRTAESAEPAPPGRFGNPEPQALRRPESAGNSHVRVDSTGEALELRFPGGRNPGAAFGLAMFVTLWSGLLYVMIRQGTPILFPIGFGLFELLLVLSLARLVLASRRVEATRDGVMLYSRVPLLTFRRSIRRDEIVAVRMRVGMQVAERPYYDVELALRRGRTVTVGGSIRDKQEAEWITRLLRERLRLEDPRESASREPGDAPDERRPTRSPAEERLRSTGPRSAPRSPGAAGH